VNGPALHLVWFKRDLRLADHAPWTQAAAAARAEAGGRGVIAGLYVVEPGVVGAPDFAGRHWACISEALTELRETLADRGWTLAVRRGEVVECLERLRAGLAQRGGTLALWSHEETGNAVTFARDRAVGAWAQANGVRWTEMPQHGVVRRLRSRTGWAQRWEERMGGEVLPEPEADAARGWRVADAGAIPTAEELGLAADPCPERQPATRAAALATLVSFLETRGRNYQREMSSPRTAATSCSRLSVPLAYGTVSLREVVQCARGRLAELLERRAAGERLDYSPAALRAFIARLHWHCHFMQKLESEPRVEFEAFLPELDALRAGPWTAEREAALDAWAEGRTGYPFIDACVRCLRDTGWINFRMRAMLMSFASYDLWLPWRESGLRLARRFADYEPGIHWPQVQMQSGTTGINTLRMYSPAKQSRDQDPEGEFIRRWVPELARVPAEFIHEPAEMPPPVARAAGVELGRDYPWPIVDHAAAVRMARAKFAELRRQTGFRERARGVFERHGSRKRPGTTIVEPRWFEGSGARDSDATEGQLQLEV